MFAQRICAIAVAMLVLGACSVYDSSLTESQGVAAGMAGSPGAAAGRSGSATGGTALGSAGEGAGEGGNGQNGGSESGGTSGGHQSGAGASGTAAGGSAATAGVAGAGGVLGGGGGLGGLTLDLIDDMEDGDAAINYGAGNRDGDWYVGHDATATGTQFPGVAFAMSPLDQTDSRYAVSKLAAMTKGTGFTDWGENLGFNMMLVDTGSGKHPPYDASAYCGLHFFGKIAAGTTSEVIVRVPDKNSHPDGGVCGAAQKPCYLHYQQLAAFGSAWTEYAVLFTDLTRTGWPAAFDVTAIYGVEFGLLPNTKFELWIDDISFLNKPRGGVCPTTP
jgi:hypothetical protein